MFQKDHNNFSKFILLIFAYSWFTTKGRMSPNLYVAGLLDINGGKSDFQKL